MHKRSAVFPPPPFLISHSNSSLLPYPHSDLKISMFRMVDHTDKGSEGDDSNPNSGSEQKKTCADCGTSKTPLWRGGPAGPKSLCNACGIRSRKKKRAILGVSKGSSDEIKKGKRSSITNNSSGNNSNKIGESLKQRLWALGKEVMMQRSTMRKKLGEEEQAAVVLMSLSYGSVYA
ncbi:hypothetical protein RIF29_07046 [Crotalaria pallida]|uniref:GATA-type domain-containing protein n=1 Tax=Crotalaria pallida TaxID=3830 RepID=A0AAN9PAM4_CROPI